MVVPITERNLEYAREISLQLRESGLRVEVDQRSEGIGKKIRDAEIQKIPYIMVLGDEEERKKVITFRIHQQGDQGSIQLGKFIMSVNKIIEEKGSHYEI
jgi:threonyl-tRNA synthetase